MDSFDIPGYRKQVEANNWCNHHFGLSADRWSKLSGKGFWITGAGTGYGRCIALALAAAGATIFLTGRRSVKLQETIKEGMSRGIDMSKCIPMVADITSEEQIQSVVSRISENNAPLFGLINNAALPQGGQYNAPLMSADLSEWQSLIATNITGQWLVTKYALPLIANEKCGRVVFMSSEAGWAFTPGFGIYNVTKAALNNLAASFAAECESAFTEMDLQINVIVAGEARTEMNQGSSISPFTIVPMILALLSHPAHGPNGFFFHMDGRYLEFAYSKQYQFPLFDDRSEDQIRQ